MILKTIKYKIDPNEFFDKEEVEITYQFEETTGAYYIFAIDSKLVVFNPTIETIDNHVI
jgi:hypothetical protein